MSYVGYSPWVDAASYGRSMGETLGTILLRLPMMKREHQLKERELQLRERDSIVREEHYENQDRIAADRATVYDQNVQSMIEAREALAEAKKTTNAFNEALALQRAELLKAQTDKTYQDMEYAPQLAQGKMALDQARIGRMEAQTQQGERRLTLDENTGMSKIASQKYRDTLASENAMTARGTANASLSNAGLDILPALTNLARPLPVEEASAPAPKATSKGRRLPPNPKYRFLFRDKKTGKQMWGTEDEKNNPEVELLEEFEG
jgi:hypothetical protein